MSSILIIGAGQLGSRHLQGVLQSNKVSVITVVDPSISALRLTTKRAEEVTNYNKNILVSYLTEVPAKSFFDICIIATSADVRAFVTRDLLKKSSVKHIIFEKVLFQRSSDYFDIKKLLDDMSVQGWVNCPRRTFSTYKTIKEEIDINMPVCIQVKGDNWGLGCNSIHFIDIFAYLVESSSIDAVSFHFTNEVVESKRVGFYEIFGTIELCIGVHSLSLECNSEDSMKLTVSLSNGEDAYFIDEIEQYWRRTLKEDGEKISYKPQFQSELTGKIVDQLLACSSCELTPLAESIELHMPLISCIQNHISTVFNKKFDFCPIT